jgi:hypothetical protein
MKKVILVVALISLLLALSGCGSVFNITLDKFNQIENGMSYYQVEQIMGVPGTLTVSSQTPGIPGVMNPISNTIYIWQNPDGSNMNVQFQNNHVICKAQAELQ